MKSFNMLHFSLLFSVRLISLSLSLSLALSLPAFHSPSVSEKAKSLKKNKIIWLSLMCFDFPISNPVIPPHMGMSIISVFHLHKFGLWTARISIRLVSTALPANNEVFSGIPVGRAPPVPCLSFVHQKHVSGVNSGWRFDCRVFAILYDPVSSSGLKIQTWDVISQKRRN